MLERIAGLPPGVEGVTAKGRVRKADYDRVVRPLVEEARREGRDQRLLYELGSEFRGFTPAALLEDARIGVIGFGHLERFAVVSDDAPVRKVAELVQSIVPRPMRVFASQDRDEAIEWLRRPPESKGLEHRLWPDLGVIVINLRGPLGTEDFGALRKTATDYLQGPSHINGVVIQAKRLPSWTSLGSFIDHVNFVRQYRHRVKRVALMLKGPLGRLLPHVMQRVVGVEVQRFGSLDVQEAMRWAAGQPDQGAPAHGDPVAQAGLESFPASDPPSFTPSH